MALGDAPFFWDRSDYDTILVNCQFGETGKHRIPVRPICGIGQKRRTVRGGSGIMTLKEIAQRAGVSVSTVSRVVNGKDAKAASPEVSSRIWKIVRETGYTPNLNAQNLQSGSSGEAQTADLCSWDRVSASAFTRRRIVCVAAHTPPSPSSAAGICSV